MCFTMKEQRKKLKIRHIREETSYVALTRKGLMTPTLASICFFILPINLTLHERSVSLILRFTQGTSKSAK